MRGIKVARQSVGIGSDLKGGRPLLDPRASEGATFGFYLSREDQTVALSPEYGVHSEVKIVFSNRHNSMDFCVEKIIERQVVLILLCIVMESY